MRCLAAVALLAAAAGCGRLGFEGPRAQTDGAPSSADGALDGFVDSWDGATGVDASTDGSVGPPPGLFVYSLEPIGDRLKVFGVDSESGALIERGSVHTAVAPRLVLPHPSRRWLYVLAYDADTGHAVIERFRVDPITGELVSLGVEVDDYDLAWGHEARFDPSGTYLYVSRYAAAGATYVYRVDSATGVVSGQVPGSPFEAGTFSLGIAVHPSGRWIYQGGLDSPCQIQINDVSAANGTLTANTTSPVTVPSLRYCSLVVMHPSGKWLYAIDTWNAANMIAFSIDQGTGALTFIQDEPDPSCNRADLIAPSVGDVLYATCDPGDRIERISVNPTSGSLTSTIFSAGTLGSHLQLTLSPTERHLQKAFDEPDGSVDIYAVALDGSLSVASTRSLGAGFVKTFSFRTP